MLSISPIDPVVSTDAPPPAASFVADASGIEFSGVPGDYLEVDHFPDLELSSGTVTVSFTADDVTGRKALFSKDASGYGDGGHLTGFVENGRLKVRLQDTEKSVTLYSPSGSIQPGDLHHLAVAFGAEGFWLYLDGETVASRTDFTTGIDTNTENLAIGANIWARSQWHPDWTADFFDGSIDTFAIYEEALSRAEIAAITPDAPAEPTAGTTGTGLDQLVDIILDDPGLSYRVDPAEIAEAAEAADRMNQIIVEAIHHTGLANDSALHEADLRDLNTYIQTNYHKEWGDLHGDDEPDQEWGFHLVQNDGASTHLFGSYNAVNTVADGIYHMGFDIDGYRFLNEDGNRNASLTSVAHWLSQLLEDDLAGDGLKNDLVDPYAVDMTGTGLDELVEIIMADPGLNKRIPTSEIVAGAQSAADMNEIILEAIRETGLANDDELNVADVRDLNGYIQTNYEHAWADLHGDDEASKEWGFHLVQNDGASTYLFNTNAVNTVADGVYHMGFDIVSDRFLNEDGNKNASVKTVTYWLGELLEEDLAGDGLKNDDVDPYAVPTTGSGLDHLVEIITTDEGLNRKIPTSEIIEGATNAAKMNQIIVEAITGLGLANDGEINTADVRDLNAHIQGKYPHAWADLHGDDESYNEWGFHLVQNDGASTYLFNTNAVNTVADGIYHVGFDIVSDRFLNEDGNRNASVKTVAYWLNELLEEDLDTGALVNLSVNPYVVATTDTGLDQLVQIIAADPGLNKRIPTSEITEGATNADAMNGIIVEAIKATGAANDGRIDTYDLVDMNRFIQTEYGDEWGDLHGDDESYKEWGFHLVQNDGASTYLFAKNAVNAVADGIYHMGFDIKYNRFLNEDGNGNASLEHVAFWLNELLEQDLLGTALRNDALIPDLTVIAGQEVYSTADVLTLSGESGDYLEVDHFPNLELSSGTVAVSFTADDVSGRHALFSKDASGYGTGGHLTGYVENGRVKVRLQNTSKSVTLYTPSGSIQPGDLHHLAVTFGPEGFRLYLDGETVSARTDFTSGIDTNTENLAIGANIWARSQWRPDWTGDYFDGTIDAFTIYEEALSRAEIAAITPDAPIEPTAGTTGTGLDQLVDIILNDPGLNYRVDPAEIAEAAEAADRMNGIIVEAIRATGLANDHALHEADLRDLNTYIQTAHGDAWAALHGDDEGSEEWGFHLVQNDGASTHLFGSYNAVNTVADGVYHMGFDIDGYNFLNEDGNRNASVTTVAHWLSQLLEDDLAGDNLTNDLVDPYAVDMTGTGLDELVEIIIADPGLNKRIPTSEIIAGAQSAADMNEIILEAIRETGLANDGDLSMADVRDLNAYIQANHQHAWTDLHGDDESCKEWGFHLVQNDGASTYLFNTNAVNTVADGVYHMGFDIKCDRFLNEDGAKNASVKTVTYWLGELLEEDLAGNGLKNDEVDPYAVPTTGTGLDQLVSIIAADPGLNYRIPTSEIIEGANNAYRMNQIIVDAIKALGLANDGEINAADVRDLNAYIQANHKDAWVDAHGDDESCKEWGFHLVQNDGASTYLFNTNAVNKVADGIYHMGFDIQCDRFLNEDGAKNASVKSVAYWLNDLLEEDLQSGELVNEDVDPYPQETTGTGLDRLVDVIIADPGLNKRISTSEIAEGAANAHAMNAIIIEAIEATGAANDGLIDTYDLVDMNRFIQTEYADAWVDLHGDDEKCEETGFHLVQNDGASTYLFGTNAVNTVADGIYHMGFDIKYNRFLNEDGNSNASLEHVAFWLNELLAEDLESGALVNEALLPNLDAIAAATVFSLDDVLGEADEGIAALALMAVSDSTKTAGETSRPVTAVQADAMFARLGV